MKLCILLRFFFLWLAFPVCNPSADAPALSSGQYTLKMPDSGFQWQPGPLSRYPWLNFILPGKMPSGAFLLSEPLCDGVAPCVLPPASVPWRILPPPENPLPFCSVAFLPASFGKCPPTWSLSWFPSPTGAWVGTPSLVFLLRPFYSSSHCNAYRVLVSLKRSICISTLERVLHEDQGSGLILRSPPPSTILSIWWAAINACWFGN